MMPEVSRIFCLAGLLLCLSSCTKHYKTAPDFVPTPQSYLETQATTSPASISDTCKIDLDLTKMSATIIYSTIFDMMMDSEKYQNKNIKVKGFFNALNDSFDNSIHFAIIIPDATACCVQGLEFIWDKNHKYPEDYPSQDQEITLTGKWTVLEDENGFQRSFLQVVELDF